MGYVTGPLRRLRPHLQCVDGHAAGGLRHRSKWLPYLDCMLQSGTVRRTAALVGIHTNTSFRWRHRFLANIKTDRT